MNKIEKRGKIAILLLFGIDIIYHIFIIIYLNSLIPNDDKTGIRIFKLLISGMLMYLTFEGSKTYKWILIAYFIIPNILSFSTLTHEAIYITFWNFFLPSSILFFKPISEFLHFQENKQI